MSANQPEVQQPSAARRPSVWNATDLASSRVLTWLAKGRIPAGLVTYMLGPEGIGKSLFLVWLTGILTTGRGFPGFGIPASPARPVVLVLTEDDWSTIARPRLELAGADLTLVRVICAEADGSGAPTFPDDIDIAAQAAQGAALVIVDAWADTLPGGLSVRDPQQARQALHPWKELATRTGAAVLLSGHTNRDKGGDVRNAYGLTGELRKTSRHTLLAQPDPDQDGALTIGPEKSNISASIMASTFRIESKPVFGATDDGDGTVPLLVWVGDSVQTSRELFAEAAAAAGEVGGDDREDIDRWLTDLLKAGQMRATEVYTAADANGYSKDQAKRAKRRLGIIADHHDPKSPWMWKLPDSSVAPGLRTGSESGSTEHRISDVLPVLPVLPVTNMQISGSVQGADRETGSTGSREQTQSQAAPCSRCGGPRAATDTGSCDRCRAGSLAGTTCPACRNPRQLGASGLCGSCTADRLQRAS